MDEMTFLEHPLDRILYEPKKFVQQAREPLRILFTEAGSKIAYNLIYQICSGSVFGPDQEIIIHLINARGTLHHKKIVLELEECGFPCFKESVLSSSPQVVFKNVEIVIAITRFQEVSGFIEPEAIVYQTNKAFQLIRNVQDYASKNCKIIFTGPATKAMTVMLSVLHKFFPNLNTENISCVTYVDVVISKAVLAAKLKITTDRIKNIIIWSATYPDVRNATIHMYPPDDRGATEKQDIPVSDVILDEEWLYTTFGLAIYRRIMNVDLLNFGKAIALSTAHHLRVLFEGSEKFKEIHSMAVITPPTRPYGLPEGIGLSYPVKTENGGWEILQNVSTNVATQLNMMRTLLESDEEKVKNALIKILSYMTEYDMTEVHLINSFPEDIIQKLMEIKKWTLKYYVIPNPAETIPKIQKVKRSSRKSIQWSEAVSLDKKHPSSIRSGILFDTSMPKDLSANSKINSIDFSNVTENSSFTSHKRHFISQEKYRKRKS